MAAGKGPVHVGKGDYKSVAIFRIAFIGMLQGKVIPHIQNVLPLGRCFTAESTEVHRESLRNL